MSVDSATRDQSAEALATRLFKAALETMDLLHIYVGDKLGIYKLMAEGETLSEADLAEKVGMHPRYAREWLEQQAVTGILSVDDPTLHADQRRYKLPKGHAEALTDEDSLNYLAPVAGMLVSAAQQMPQLLPIYRTGGGLDWSAYGPDMWQGQAAVNRPLFINKLGDYLRSISELDAILMRPGSRVADLACGGGWSSVAMARAYPSITVDGYDLDASSIEQATKTAAAVALSHRVRFHALDLAKMPAVQAGFDLVTIFEAVHDLSDPIGVLRIAHGMLRKGGLMLVMDERVAEAFIAPGDDVERFTYGWSLTVCLPCGMSEQPSAATGTVMRASTFTRYAREAGFSGVDVLPIENDFFRFYLLRP